MYSIYFNDLQTPCLVMIMPFDTPVPACLIRNSNFTEQSYCFFLIVLIKLDVESIRQMGRQKSAYTPTVVML